MPSLAWLVKCLPVLDYWILLDLLHHEPGWCHSNAVFIAACLVMRCIKNHWVMCYCCITHRLHINLFDLLPVLYLLRIWSIKARCRSSAKLEHPLLRQTNHLHIDQCFGSSWALRKLAWQVRLCLWWDEMVCTCLHEVGSMLWLRPQHVSILS